MSNQIQFFRTVDADPSTVFDAWVSPDTVVAPVTAVSMDAAVGGSVRISTSDTAGDDLQGTFLAVERPHRLTYTWSWNGTAEETLVEVMFHAVGARTVVAITHSGFLGDASMQTHLKGWVSYLDGLVATL